MGKLSARAGYRLILPATGEVGSSANTRSNRLAKRHATSKADSAGSKSSAASRSTCASVQTPTRSGRRGDSDALADSGDHLVRENPPASPRHPIGYAADDLIFPCRRNDFPRVLRRDIQDDNEAIHEFSALSAYELQRLRFHFCQSGRHDLHLADGMGCVLAS